MEKHHLLSDVEFEKQFESCLIEPEWFTHEAHLRLAWVHIRQYGIDQAIQNVCEQLIRFTEFVGAKDKYNKTVTVAGVKAVDHFIRRSQSKSFIEFVEEFPRLKLNFRQLMEAHYSVNIFKSESAKAEFLQPDLLPFD
jgi:hypothetical protein